MLAHSLAGCSLLARPCCPGAATAQAARRRCPPCCAASKGFGGGDSSGGGTEGGGSAAHRLQDTLKEQREVQLTASQMLAKLLQAEDPREAAEECIDSLNEEFFYVANTYLSMAQKEGNQEVTGHIETALKAAMEAKQATLRPEIQLLNRLLGAEDAAARQRLLFGPEAADTLRMNDRYFFGLLERMQKDVARQPDSPQKALLVQRLDSIHQDASAAAAGAGA